MHCQPPDQQPILMDYSKRSQEDHAVDIVLIPYYFVETGSGQPSAFVDCPRPLLLLFHQLLDEDPFHSSGSPSHRRHLSPYRCIQHMFVLKRRKDGCGCLRQDLTGFLTVGRGEVSARQKILGQANWSTLVLYQMESLEFRLKKTAVTMTI